MRQSATRQFAGPATREVLDSITSKGEPTLLVSKEGAAKILGLHPKTVERLIGRGELLAYKPAGRIRIDCDDLRTYLERVRVEPTIHDI
ncbi:MAG TPA: helix-turn-helix domain-containing protein [Solirubrobacteraceae bacterium]|nr:helix-turn-helix domain-containing protein [Solirubrobacteraceae bacterium]